MKYVVVVFVLALLVCLPLGVLKIVRSGRLQNLLQATYHNHGIQFSHYRYWRVEEPAAAPASLVNGSGRIKNDVPMIHVSGPHGATMTFALCKTSSPLTLKTYAERVKSLLPVSIKEERKDSVTETDPLEPVVGQIHGTQYAGLRYHFTVTVPGSSYSRFHYFFLLWTLTNKVMFTMQLPEQYVDAPEVRLILDSMILDGAIDPAAPACKKVGMILYKPGAAVAMIGNDTFKTGDVVDGFKIIDIEKDSVTVQSTAGAKTALHLGDALK